MKNRLGGTAVAGLEGVRSDGEVQDDAGAGGHVRLGGASVEAEEARWVERVPGRGGGAGAELCMELYMVVR